MHFIFACVSFLFSLLGPLAPCNTFAPYSFSFDLVAHEAALGRLGKEIVSLAYVKEAVQHLNKVSWQQRYCQSISKSILTPSSNGQCEAYQSALSTEFMQIYRP